MNRQNKIALNFLTIEPQDFEFRVYRKLKEGNESNPDKKNITGYSLPVEKIEDKRNSYWVSFNQMEGFEEYTCNSISNIYLTEQFLFKNLLDKLKKVFPDKIAKVEDKFYKKRIFISVKKYENIGRQTVWIEPYFLKAISEFGFLVDCIFLRFRTPSPDLTGHLVLF